MATADMMRYTLGGDGSGTGSMYATWSHDIVGVTTTGELMDDAAEINTEPHLSITGSINRDTIMTLGEVEKWAGVPVGDLITLYRKYPKATQDAIDLMKKKTED